MENTLTLGIGGHQSAKMKNDEWLTPKWITDSLGPFDIDPCSPINRPWPTADLHYTVLDNGLEKQWDGFVWLNPPYGKNTGKWLHRMSLNNAGIALVFARTETKMFFEHVWGKASCILFLSGRLHFHYVDGTRAHANSGAPSCLIGYGIEAEKRLFKIRDRGFFVKLEQYRY